jgi:predicted amidohydrolase
MSRELGIGTCQIDTVPGEIERNLQALADSMRATRHHSPWASLICAPELCLQGIPNMAAVAQAIPGELTDRCADLARQHGVYLVPGTFYERCDGRIYNTAPVFDPQGKLVATYRKLYPWRPAEKTTSGKADDTLVFEVPGAGRVGLCICYDLWFPELLRDLVWKGAELLLVPTATGTADRAQELILAQAAAIANQCFVVSVNGAGRGGVGRSLIVDPEGNVMQQTGQVPENMAARLDLDRVQSVRLHGTCGVSRPLASFFHEKHRFSYQDGDDSQSPLREWLPRF